MSALGPRAKLRLWIGVIACIGLALGLLFWPSVGLASAIGITASLLQVATFIEPAVQPVSLGLFREASLARRSDIYKQVVKAFNEAENIIRFKSPTTTWGLYSAGLEVLEKTLDAIREACSRGVKVRIIADIWDWDRAIFAQELLRAGAEVRHSENVHDYFLVQDEDLLVKMETKDSKPRHIPSLRRSVRQLRGTAKVSRKPDDIRTETKPFDEQWDRLTKSSTESVIEERLAGSCPKCHQRLIASLENGVVDLNRA